VKGHIPVLDDDDDNDLMTCDTTFLTQPAAEVNTQQPRSRMSTLSQAIILGGIWEWNSGSAQQQYLGWEGGPGGSCWMEGVDCDGGAAAMRMRWLHAK
jgi:hypothetical protein